MNLKIIFLSLTAIILIWNVIASDVAFDEKFAWELSATVGLAAPTENVVISPLLIQAALTLLYYGSVGDTATQLRNILHLEQYATQTQASDQVANFLAKTIEKVKNETRLASAFYAQQHTTFRYDQQFQETAKKFNISTVMEDIDVDAAQRIVADFKQNAGIDLSKFFVKFEKESSLFMLIAGLKFQAPWQFEFQVDKEKKILWQLSKRSNRSVDCMHSTAVYKYAELPELHARAIEIPFQNQNLTMLILIPNEIKGLAVLEKKIRFKNITALVRELPAGEMELSMPEFDVNYYIELTNSLDFLGLGDIFTDNADFGRTFTSFLNHRKQYLNAVLHKTELVVNKAGQEKPTSSKKASIASKFNKLFKKNTKLIVDRPFYFAIRTNEAVLLAGHIVDVPTVKKNDTTVNVRKN